MGRCHLRPSLSGGEKRRQGAPEGETGGDLGAELKRGEEV